jgi:2-dehydropantoate 2-reductase
VTPAAASVIGSGALASLVGARMARAGVRITLLGTWSEALAVVDRHGVTVEDETGRWHASVCAMRLGTVVAPAALVMVLVKSQQTAAIASAAAVAVAPQGVILTLQNGLGNSEQLAAAAGAERVLTGIALLGATSLAAGVVRDGGGRQLVLAAHPRQTVAAEMLSAAGFDVGVVPDIAPTQWLKLAANCAINPLTALNGVRNGALLEDAELRATLRAAALEVGRVAEAAGVRLTADPAEEALRLARVTAANCSSMLADVRRGAPTEIEALNGAIVRLAEQHGIAVPVNRRLLAQVRALSAAHQPC